MGVIGIFASIPLIILYALLPGVLNLAVDTNIDSWHYFTIVLAVILFFLGSQLKS